jgi:hypothetical protein
VPVIVRVEVFESYHADVMLVPGAKRSWQEPHALLEALASELVELPTVRASGTRCGL